MARIGANELCPCGSGKKYKRCCRARDLAEQSERVRTRLSWESVLRAERAERGDVARQLLEQKGFHSEDTDAWVGFAQVARERGAQEVVEVAFQEGSRRARTSEDWWALLVLSLELGRSERAWRILCDHLPPETDTESRQMMLRGHLLTTHEHWEEAAVLWEALLAREPSRVLFWKLLGVHQQARHKGAFVEVCERASAAFPAAIWSLAWANARHQWGEGEAAQTTYEAHFEEVLATPAEGDEQERSYEERVLLQAAQLFLPTCAAEEREALLQRMLTRALPGIDELWQLRCEVLILCQAWALLHQEASRWRRETRASLAQWLWRLTQVLTGARSSHESLLRAPPSAWERWPLPIQQACLRGLLDVGAVEIAWGLLEALAPLQDEALLELWATLCAQRGEDASVLSRFSLEAPPSSGLLRLLLGRALLRVQRLEEAAQWCQELASTLEAPLSMLASVWWAEACVRLDRPEEGLSVLLALESREEGDLSGSYWIWRALCAAKLSRMEEAADAMRRLFLETQEGWCLEAWVRYHLLAEQPERAIDALQQGRQLVAWSEELSWLLAWSAQRCGQWSLASDALQTIPKTWFQEELRWGEALQMQLICAVEAGRWPEALAACEMWEQVLEGKGKTSAEDVELRSQVGDLDEAEEGQGQGALLGEHEELQPLRRWIARELLQATHPALLEGEAVTSSVEFSARLRSSLQERWVSTQQERTLALQKKQELRQREALTHLEETQLQQQPSMSQGRQQAPLPQAAMVCREWWGADVWGGLPEDVRGTFVSAERLWKMLQEEEAADHAPVWMQWMRGVEVLVNRHLVDAMALFATRRLGLQLYDLPRLGGRLLRPGGNQIGLGSVPFLLAEEWPRPEGEKDKEASFQMFNFQVTAAQRLLWEAWRRHLEASLSPAQSAFVSQELPGLCAQLAALRNQVAHETHTLSRKQVGSWREQFLFARPPLLFESLAHPLFS